MENLTFLTDFKDVINHVEQPPAAVEAPKPQDVAQPAPAAPLETPQAPAPAPETTAVVTQPATAPSEPPAQVAPFL